jgi:alpha-tubulin suppressor-like RCC1 family protein
MLALSRSGNLFTWGSNFYGQLGNNIKFEDQNTPYNITSQFKLYENETIIDAEFGYEFAVAITSAGRVFTWGSNVNDSLGDDDSVFSRIQPNEITSFFKLTSVEKVVSINVGRNSTYAITNLNNIYKWGGYYFYSTSYKTPTKINFLSLSNDPVTIFSIFESNYIFKTKNGVLWTGDYNDKITKLNLK